MNEYVNHIGRRSTLSISTWVYFWEPLEYVLREIAEAGYSKVEIWADKANLQKEMWIIYSSKA